MPKNTELFRASNRASAQVQAAKKIATTTERYVEVLASPGSGKTHTLIARLSHLLTSGVPAAQILVLSFSNEAVRELRRRLDSSALDPASAFQQRRYFEVPIQTAHAFARSLLRKPPDVLPDSRQRKLLKTAIKGLRKRMPKRKLWADLSVQQRQKCRECLEELQEPQKLRWLLALFDRARAACVDVKAALKQIPGSKQYELPPPNLVAAIFKAYQRIKDKQHSMDFGDMLRMGAQRLERKNDGKLTGTDFQHILVDEFQDCSPAQTELIAALARHCDASVMVFGDPLQSIYGFAGSHYQGLASALPAAKTMRLPVSFRLTSETAALACAVANKSSKVIQTSRTGLRPTLTCSTDENAQARAVALDVKRLIATGVAPGDIAVLSRIKALLNPIEAELAALAINTERMGQNREPQHVLNVLRLVRRHRHYHRKEQVISSNQLRQISVADRVIAPEHAEKVAKQLMRTQLPTSFAGQYKACCKAYLRLLGGMRAAMNIEAAHEINRWASTASRFSTVAAFRQGMLAMTSQQQRVTTGTIHSAKGREWSHVLIVGATDGILPHYKSRDADTLKQEQNLIYVAITRAKDRACLYHAPIINARSRQKFTAISRLLNARAQSLLEKHKSARGKTVANSVTAH